MLRKLPGDHVENVVSTRPDTSIHYRPLVVRTPGIVFLFGHLFKLFSALGRMVWRHPMACALWGAAGAYLYVFGWKAMLLALALEACLLGIWGSVWPRSFARYVRWPLVSWWRWLVVYRRRWRGVMAVSGLGHSVGGRGFLPDLARVQSGPWADKVTVKMLGGQSDEDWATKGGNLAHGFGAVSCQMAVLKPGWLLLSFPRRDALAEPIAALPYPVSTSVRKVEIGLDETGRRYWLKVHGTHVLLAGATGAGKGSWLWCIVRGLLPAVAEGLAELWALDPKLMELSYGMPLFHQYASSPTACALLLERAVEVMQERAERYAGVRRDHVPTSRDPFIVVIVDEVAFLTAYQPDRNLKARIMAALSTLTTQGRAVGIGVVAALQDPRKDVLNIRNLFPDRVALRLDEAEQVDMVLGDGARDRGALADQIARDPNNPQVGAGIGFVRLENRPQPIRVRAAYVSDADIRDMVHQYGAAGEAE
ncbi:FtsK/SpoIIIE domain-containing protein [Nonomuraea sp. NPDC049028]|uniref:FtsK/SpoIIIE domain-containing protein n=1 Tax=Nonomuraea sp. NPDC049028 TaxID=3364348 RepID=UPI00371F2B1A